MKSIGTTFLFATVLLGSAVTQVHAAPLPDTTTLNCKFPAAEAPNRIKPGAKNVSDGVIRINPENWTLNICKGCAWENTGAKWQVNAKEFRASTPHGLQLVIARADGAARLTITARPDEHYQGGRVESMGQCTPADAAK